MGLRGHNCQFSFRIDERYVMDFQPEIPYHYETNIVQSYCPGCEVGSHQTPHHQIFRLQQCAGKDYPSFQIYVHQTRTGHQPHPQQVTLLFLWTGSFTWPKPPADIWLEGFRSTLLPAFYTNCTPPNTSKNKDANQRTENWHWILSQRKPKTLRLGSVGEWSWLCPCSSSTVIWHVQRFALLQALRHWSKQAASARPGNNNRNKGTNDFVPTPAWCLPPAHHGPTAYSRCLSSIRFRTSHIHPTYSSHHFLPSTECRRDWQTLWWTSFSDVKVHFKQVLCWSLLTSSPLKRWTCAGLKTIYILLKKNKGNT